MRSRLRHGVAAAVLAIILCVPAAYAADVEDGSPSSPAGDSDVVAEPDPLFDETFDEAFDLESDMEKADPFESANRKVFAFNTGLDDFFFSPITRGYRFLVPKPARTGIRRVFLNLKSPRILVNDLLQLRFKDAATTFGRFALNTAFGLGGLLDPATDVGWERHDSDFGQTLAKAGVRSGPYLVVPVFGPTTVRDGFGDIVDLAFQPLTYIFGPSDWLLQVYIGSGNGLTVLEHSRDKVDALEESSVDFYAAMRSAYLQNRRAITGESEKPGDAEPASSVPPVGEQHATVRAQVVAGGDSAH